MPNSQPKIALRMDDPGASSKFYEVHSKTKLKLKSRTLFSGDWFFFKYISPFKAWGRYRELSAKDWEDVIGILERRNAKLTVAVTATWASPESQIPFNHKFPDTAKALKQGVKLSLIEIANHGLTHNDGHPKAYRPSWFEGNRQHHREFKPGIPISLQREHIKRAQDILQSFFETEIVTFVPPGNAFTSDTLQVAKEFGIRYVSCNAEPRSEHGLEVLGNANTIAFHDKDLVEGDAAGELERFIDSAGDAEFVFVKDLA